MRERESEYSFDSENKIGLRNYICLTHAQLAAAATKVGLASV